MKSNFTNTRDIAEIYRLRARHHNVDFLFLTTNYIPGIICTTKMSIK